MRIADIQDKRAIVVGIQSQDKPGALRELLNVMAEVYRLDDSKEIYKTLIEREKLGSTGIGQGIAIPHGKTERVKDMVACFGISHKGVNFEALDGEPVYIFFMLLAPKSSAGPHLKALAKISRLLRDSYFCNQLRHAKDAEELYKMIDAEEARRAT